MVEVTAEWKCKIQRKIFLLPEWSVKAIWHVSLVIGLEGIKLFIVGDCVQ